MLFSIDYGKLAWSVLFISNANWILNFTEVIILNNQISPSIEKFNMHDLTLDLVTFLIYKTESWTHIRQIIYEKSSWQVDP